MRKFAEWKSLESDYGINSFAQSSICPGNRGLFLREVVSWGWMLLAPKAETALPGLVPFTESRQIQEGMNVAERALSKAKEMYESKQGGRKGNAYVSPNAGAEVCYLTFPPQLGDYSRQVPGFHLSAFLAEQ